MSLESSERIDANIPPGFVPHDILLESPAEITTVTWSPDGQVLASGSSDHTIHLWDQQSGQHLQTLIDYSHNIRKLAWSPDGRMLASGSYDSAIHLWDAQTGQHLQAFKGQSSSAYSMSMTWSPDGRLLAYTGNQKIYLWNTQTGDNLQTFIGHPDAVYSLAWSPDGRMLASGSGDNTVYIWDVQTGHVLQTLIGHTAAIYSVAWSPDGQVLASGSVDKTIRLWKPGVAQETHILEGQTDTVNTLSFSYDGLLLASKSWGSNIACLWRCDTWESVGTLEESTLNSTYKVLAFHPRKPTLVTLGTKNTILRIWDLDLNTILGTASTRSSVHYTTAKIALVGDSGVGKSGLGYRIAEDLFRITESTHGQQFWVVDKLGKMRTDGTQCEAVLWDFAGQSNFRPIHALFLDDIDLALVLFDPSRPDTFTGVNYWLKQLSHNGEQCRTVLVAARADVSTQTLSTDELEAFCRERNISGGFVITSAKTGKGIDPLVEVIRQQIEWDAKPTTVTTETFKRIKDYVLAQKANANRKHVLISPAQLRAQLEALDQHWHFTDTEMMTAVGHLQNHGYVTLLRRSSNEQSILLAPDLLINLSASYMLKAQLNEKGLGALEEARALRNEYHFPEVEDLNEEERDTLLSAATELFLKRNICFRESVDGQTFLIFPSLILERPPRLTEDRELVEDIAYVVTGPIENLYPALVVLLGYSPSFQRTNQWRNQAQYETIHHYICGFRQTNDEHGELELVLYYGRNTPDFFRSRFQGLFEEILYTHSRNLTVRKYPPIFCRKCGRQQERRIVIRRIREGKTFLFCDEDGQKMNLPKTAKRIVLSRKVHAEVTTDQALSNMRTTYEAALVRVKGFARDQFKATPTCFVSYAWGNTMHERWVLKLSDDLRKADIIVTLDQWNNSTVGANMSRFVSRIEQSDFIIVVGTSSYRQKYENRDAQYGSMVAAEVDLINVRLTGTEAQKASVLPVLLEGKERSSFPPLLHRRVYSDFTREEYYFVSLFDLVLTLYQIPFDDPIVGDLRAKLREEAQALTTKH